MAKLQDLNLVTTKTGQSVVLIKDSRNGSPEDHQISVTNFLLDRVQTSKVSTSPNVGQIPEMVDDGDSLPALPEVSGKNLLDLEEAIQTGSSTDKGIVKLSNSILSNSGVDGGLAATPSAVKNVVTLLNNGLSGKSDTEHTHTLDEVGVTEALGVSIQPYSDETPVSAITEAEILAGNGTDVRSMSPADVVSVIEEHGGGAGATGGGDDEVFYENSQHVTTSYTIPVGKNAMSTGPIVIDEGADVVISEGSSWVIL